MRHWSKNRTTLSMLRPKPAPKKEYKLDADNREKVLEEYLYRWQLEHNTALADEGEAVELMRWWFCRTTG